MWLSRGYMVFLLVSNSSGNVKSNLMFSFGLVSFVLLCTCFIWGGFTLVWTCLSGLCLSGLCLSRICLDIV